MTSTNVYAGRRPARARIANSVSVACDYTVWCVCCVSQVMGLVDCVSNRPLDYSLGAHQLDLYLYVLVIVLCNVPRTEASSQPLVSLSSRTKLLARIQNAFVGETRRATVVDSRYKLPQIQMLHSSSCFYCRGVVMHTCALHIAHCRPVRLDRRHFRHGLVLVPSLDRARTGDG